MIADDKIIFILYYPGCSGRFISALVNKLYNHDADIKITRTAEVINRSTDKYSNITQITSDETFNEILWYTYGVHPDLKIKMDDILSKMELNYPSYPVPIELHIIDIEYMMNKFPNSKFIISFPMIEKEVETAHSLFTNKRYLFNPEVGKNWIIGQHPKRIEKLCENSTNNLLQFRLFDIFNYDKVDENLNKLIDFLQISDDYKEQCKEFYIRYLKSHEMLKIFPNL